MKTIKDRYSNELLDEIFIYFMRTILHLQKNGIEDLPLENQFPEPVKAYLDFAMELLIDGQMPEIAGLLLQTEYDLILAKQDYDREIILNLHIIRELSLHLHYDTDYYGYLLSLENLWGNRVSEYASRTFYQNLPEDLKEKYQIHALIQYLPKEMQEPDNY